MNFVRGHILIHNSCPFYLRDGGGRLYFGLTFKCVPIILMHPVNLHSLQSPLQDSSYLCGGKEYNWNRLLILKQGMVT